MHGVRAAVVVLGLFASNEFRDHTNAQVAAPADLLGVLETSRDRDALTSAAVAVASSGDQTLLASLGRLLRRTEFLARLDDLNTPSFKTSHLRRVFAALAAHPSAATEQLCLTLASDASFLADDDRRIDLLPALAAVRPMGSPTTQVLKRANAEGYYSTNAPLLTKNGSPGAMALFEEMIRDRETSIERRIDALHSSIPPWRATLAVLDSAGRLTSAPLENEVALGVIESVFDEQIGRRFGPSGSAPRPAPWDGAPTSALERVLELAAQVKSHKLPRELAAAVDRTTTTVQRILAIKRPPASPIGN